MSLDTNARNALSAFVRTKRSLCEKEGGPVDLGVQLDVSTRDGRVIALVPDRDVIVPAVRQIEAEHGAVTEVIFLADAYGRKARSEDDMHSVRQGDLSRAFDEGDMEIVEMLVLTGIDISTGEMVAFRMTYHYDDTGLPKFGQVEPMGETALEGAVPDELRRLKR